MADDLDAKDQFDDPAAAEDDPMDDPMDVDINVNKEDEDSVDDSFGERAPRRRRQARKKHKVRVVNLYLGVLSLYCL